MSENTLQIIAICKFIWVAGFAGFYGFGGVKNKWLRRFCGSFWMGLGIFAFSYQSHSWHWWYLAYPLLLCGALHLGYGADELPRKITRRFIAGFAIGVASLPLVFPNHLYLLFGYGVFLSTINSVILGAFNICKNARDEESLVATIGSIIPLFLI